MDKNPKNIGYTLRSEDYRYTEWRDMKTGNLLDQELYDLTKGSLPNKNLARMKLHQARLGQFSKIMEDGYKAALPDSL